MYSRTINDMIRDLEMCLGNSHRCNNCGRDFLAHSDGCPNCGASDLYVTPLNTLSLNDLPVRDGGNTISYEEDGSFIIVKAGDSSPWPRV